MGYIWMCCFGHRRLSMCVCSQPCKLGNSLSISMCAHTAQAQWSLTQRALSCICVPYWLSEGSMQHFYLWFISLALQAHWVLFDWVLWPLVFKVQSWETIDHCTGNLTQFRRCTVPGRLCSPKTHRVLHSLFFTHTGVHTHTCTVGCVVPDSSGLH